jgi:hypothetical protein
LVREVLNNKGLFSPSRCSTSKQTVVSTACLSIVSSMYIYIYVREEYVRGIDFCLQYLFDRSMYIMNERV